MTRVTYISIAGISLLLLLLLGCGALGLAVREGAVEEIGPIWFPPQNRYQLIIRIGDDAVPWDRRSGRQTAINVWVHGRGTSWHIVNLVRIPMGSSQQEEARGNDNSSSP
jgi:hypothetical protein